MIPQAPRLRSRTWSNANGHQSFINLAPCLPEAARKLLLSYRKGPPTTVAGTIYRLPRTDPSVPIHKCYTPISAIEAREKEGLMHYKKGDRVKHPAKEDWGLGEVLEDPSGKNIRIFFVGAGEKTLSLSHVQPRKVTGDMAEHPVLDNLRIAPPGSAVRYQSLPRSIKTFLEQFPEGFYGEKFKRHERDYKEKAHVLVQRILSKEEFFALLSDEAYSEVAKRSLKLLNATNLVFPNEKMALKDGLSDQTSQMEFSNTLFELLYGEDELKQRFTAFSTALDNMNAGKWTIATYFPFMASPDKYMFVKPTITKHAAELCGFEINYKPELNWLTYKSVLDLSDYLLKELSKLSPRDMIDVQSFMWCISPGTYKDS